MATKNNVHEIFDNPDQLITDNSNELLYILNPVRAALAALEEGVFTEEDTEAVLRGLEMQIQKAIKLVDEIMHC